MHYFNKYIISIIAVLVLSSVAEQLISDGKWNKFLRFVVGILLVICIINPIIKISDFGFSFDNYIVEDNFNSDIVGENIKKQFSNKLSDVLIDDIKNTFGKDIKAECQMSKNNDITIYIKGRIPNEIIEYIEKNYSADNIVCKE